MTAGLHIASVTTNQLWAYAVDQMPMSCHGDVGLTTIVEDSASSGDFVLDSVRFGDILPSFPHPCDLIVAKCLAMFHTNTL